MRVSKFTIFLFATLAVISTLLAKFQTTVNVDSDHQWDAYNDSLSNGDVFPDDRLRHIMWFLQVSDLHLSLFQDHLRGPDFRKFCLETIPTIQPSVVLATGDLIDAKTPDHIGSHQYVEEWKMYQQILYDTGVTMNTTWLDIRGNHDNFNVLSVNDADNLFRKFSVQGKKHSRSYMYQLHHDTESYAFIGLDACMDPGPKWPFNFLGVIKMDEYQLLQNFRNQSKGDNMTIWFGHYPTSTIVSPKPGARELVSGPYLCGHLHTLGGMVPEMYTLQSTGTLELELGDWKDSRRYRIAAVDYGMFSFTDHHLDDWPLILITNPKAALFTMPSIEPLYRIKKSSHVRVLIFSPYAVDDAKFKVDNGEWQKLEHIEGPLYVSAWNPSSFLNGLHRMVVYVKDHNGSEKFLDHQFSLDGTRPTFPLGARLALMGHVSVGQTIFATILILTILPLCVLRVIMYVGKDQEIKVKCELSCCRRWVFKLYLLSSVDLLFSTVVLGALYVAVGPWFIGYIIDGHIGVCFVWGIFIAGIFLPGGLTFFAGSVYLLTFYIPFILCLSHCLYHHYRSTIVSGGVAPCGFMSYVCRHIIMLVFITWETLYAVGYFFSYGTMAFLLGFTHSWSIIMALILWRVAVTIPNDTILRIGKYESRQTVGTPLLPGEQAEQRIGQVCGGINPS